MNKLNSILTVALLAITFTSCKKEKEPVIVVPPSDGSTLTLNGLIGNETGTTPGASAGNSVYVDFSKDKATSVDRDSWDLGFYAGADFKKVILNATNGASVIKIDKIDLNSVTAADVNPDKLKIGQGGGVLDAKDDKVIALDDPREASILNKTAIATISGTESENKVYIINRKGGANTVLATTELYKIRILRKGTGYTLQYAKVGEATFKTLDVVKNAESNFQFVSLVKGSTANVEPVKADWDLVWGWSMYHTVLTDPATGVVTPLPYGYSDLVFINNLGGVQAAEVLTTATVTYAAFAEANISGLTFNGARDAIGSKWRSTSPATGVRTDRFYVIKDGAGNIYKLKFVSMGVGGDGGERGKPVIEYKLVKKG